MVLSASVRQKLNNLYTRPDSVASFQGIKRLYDEAKKRKIPVTLRQIGEFLKSKRTYSLHLMKPGRFLRPQMIAYGYRYMFQMDIFYALYPNSNRKQHFLLLVVE